MRLENSFVVDASAERAWELLNDVPRVVPCMPGATLTEVVDDDRWKATLAVKLGPISLDFGVDVEREQVDEAARRVVLSAKARELRGRGGADARLESSLASTEAGTRVTVATDLTLRGAVAQYGRGVVGDVAAQLTREFAECIGRQLQDDGGEPSPESTTAAQPAPIAGGRLFARAVLRRLARLLRRRR